MYKLLFVLACIPALALASYPVTPCLAGPSPLAVRIEGCTGPPCEVHRGSSINFAWDFVANTGASNLNLQITAVLEGISIGIPLDPNTANACNGLTLGSCPYVAGQILTHSARIPIPAFIPSGVVVTVITQLNNSNGVVVCGEAIGYVV